MITAASRTLSPTQPPRSRLENVSSLKTSVTVFDPDIGDGFGRLGGDSSVSRGGSPLRLGCRSETTVALGDGSDVSDGPISMRV